MKLIRLPDGTYINPLQVVSVGSGEDKKSAVIAMSDGEIIEIRRSRYDVASLLEAEYDFPPEDPHSIDGVLAGVVEGQRCDSAGCVRRHGHTGFCATNPEIAKKHDQA